MSAYSVIPAHGLTSTHATPPEVAESALIGGEAQAPRRLHLPPALGLGLASEPNKPANMAGSAQDPCSTLTTRRSIRNHYGSP